MRFRRKKKSKKRKEKEASQENGQTSQDKHSSVDTPPRSQSADNLTGSETPSPLTPETVPDTPTSDPAGTDSASPAVDSPTANGDMKAGSGVIDGSGAVKTPPTERKVSRFAAISRIFKPWKWRRRKKPSEKIEKTAVDLERKISVRTSREELIKRGVLKEVDENGDPIVLSETPIPEEDETDSPEAVKEDGDHEYQKQPNGSATATPTLPHLAMCDGNMTNSINGNCDGEPMVQTPQPTDNSISLSPEYYMRQGSTPVSHHQHGPIHHPNYAGEDYQRQDSSLDPKQIRVMLPVGDRDRQVPVLQKIQVVHDPPDYKPLPPPDHHHHTPIVSSAYSNSPMLNNNVYTPTGLTYPTPTLKTQTIPAVQSPTTPVSTGFTEVSISEPDLAKRPLRSAMKGAKSKQLLQQQLQQKLQEKQRQLQYAENHHHGGSLSRAPPKVAPKPNRASLLNAQSSLSRVHGFDVNNKENEMYDNVPDYDNLHSSDSDDDVQYDERDRESILAARVQRQDSLAKFLNHRPPRKVLIERNILPHMSDIERQREKDLIGKRLTRRLSLRPTAEDLENRNILHSTTTEQFYREKEEKKKTLVRKLSFRPTVEELRGLKIIMFSDYVEVTDTSEYDRRADKPWTRLTPKDKAAIRKELNEFKSTEMDVHDESRHLTRFHRP